MTSLLATELSPSLCWVAEELRRAERGKLVPFELGKWIDSALEISAGKTVRKRSLSPADMLWLIVALAIFRGGSIRDVAMFLGLQGDGRKPAAISSIVEARQRLGAAPLRQLFEELTVAWGLPAVEQDTWHGLGVYAMDGTTLSVPDTDENYEHFGKPSSRDGDAGYPKLRMVALIAVRSQLILDAQFAPWRGKGTGEQSLADSFWSALPSRSVLLFDRGFNHIGRMVRYTQGEPERFFVTRERAKFKYEIVNAHTPTDEQIRTKVSDAERKADPDLPEYLQLRRITYTIPGSPTSVLLTTLLDHELYPADEIVALYHERWSIELAYRDIKTTQLQALESLRSKTVEGVEQELWGILIAYQLVRKRMYDVAERHHEEPNRLSFKTSLLAIQFLCIQMHPSGTDAERVRAAMDVVDAMIMNGLMPAKKLRPSYDRAVKVKMSSYKRNRGKRKPAAKGKAKEKRSVTP